MSLTIPNTFTANTLIKSADMNANFTAISGHVGAAEGSNNHVVITDGSGNLSHEATLAKSRGGTNQDNSSLTFPASGTVPAITPNNHGVVLSGSGAAATVIAPDASTVKVLVSGGASADPAWGTVAATAGGTGQTAYTTGDMVYCAATNALSRLAIGTNGQILRTEGGVPTWTTPLSGGLNYIGSNPDAEIDTSGWATYSNSAANIPSNGTGGSPNSTWTRTTSTPLRGSGSFLWTKAGAANRQGEGVSFDFTIDNADQAKPLAITFDYTIVSGTFTASNGTTAPLNDGTTSTNAGNSDLEVFIYDKTNTVLIPVSPQVLTGSQSSKYNFKAVFQTASNSTSYRLIIHTATTTTNNFTIQFDNVFVGPQPVSYGAPVSDWTSYTPTVSAGFGTVTNNTSWWRRIGDSIEIQGGFTTGTCAGSVGRISIPSNLSIDTSKINSNGQIVGWITDQQSPGTSNIPQIIPLSWVSGTSNVSLTNLSQGASANNLTEMNVNAAGFPNSTNQAFYFKVPIAGWSSTVLMSNDTDTRVVAAIITGDPASASSGNPIIVPTVGYDSHGSYNASTGRYTVPVSGIYKIYGALQSASSATTLTIYKNASSSFLAGNLDSNGKATYVGAVNCVAGDIIDIRPGGTVDATNMAMVIERLSGPSAIASTESVNDRYYASSTSISGSLATISWTAKDFDSHNSMSSGTYTVPTSGKYQVNIAVALSGTFALNNLSVIEIQKNGTVVSREKVYAAAATTQIGLALSDIITCVAGDTLRVQVSSAGTGPAIVSSNYENYMSLCRVGN